MTCTICNPHSLPDSHKELPHHSHFNIATSQFHQLQFPVWAKLLCSGGQKWVHKVNNIEMDTANGVLLQMVDKVCLVTIRDMLEADGE